LPITHRNQIAIHYTYYIIIFAFILFTPPAFLSE